MISPMGVSISSATITWKGAISLTRRAPSIVPWSATATQLMPILWQRWTMASGVVVESKEYRVCR